MISSIFGKTKPINYLILLGFLFLFYWLVHFLVLNNTYSVEQLLLQTAVLAILLFSLFVVNFIVKRNQITGTNSFAILFYTLLIVLFSEVLTDNNVIACSFFLLLATRKLISLRSLKNIKLKLYDATLWIMVSSLFYDWALLYLILVFLAIYFYEPKNIKNWLVPINGIATVLILTSSLLMLIDNLAFLEKHYTFSLDFNSNFFSYWGNSTKLVIYVFVVFFSGLIAFIKLGKLGVGRIITMRLIAISFLIGIVVTFLKSSDSTFPVMLTFFPASIFIAKYVETIKRINIKETVLYAIVFVPFLVFISEWIVK